MKLAIAIVAAVTISGTAMAHNPNPQHRPAIQQANLGGPALARYQVAMPNGRIRECTETRHREAGRGVVFNKTCYRVR
jgi:hypothetical protein